MILLTRLGRNGTESVNRAHGAGYKQRHSLHSQEFLMRRGSLVVAVLACACGSTEPGDETEVPNVTMYPGVEMVTTDTAVLVNGERFIDFGHGPRGVFVDHFTEYTYGGMYERINDELVGESWYMDVGRRIVTDVRGDTVFTRALDLGDVALEGTPALRHEVDTAIVVDAGDQVHVYENIIVNRVLIYSHRLNMDGSEVSFAHEPYYERMLAGEAIELTASGSEDIEPTSASITLRQGMRITSLRNGEELPFEHELTVFRTDLPLVVNLDRPLDPDRSLLLLAYAPPPPFDVDPDVVRRATAVFKLQERTDRLVIPASALAAVASQLPAPEGGFVFRIYEYRVMEDALEIVRIKDGITEALSALQSNGFGLYVRLRR
jgi:hypothetical protein